VFAENPEQTSLVKNFVSTTGSPIQQPRKQIPQALKSVVSTKVHQMLDNDAIHPSSSMWSSPVIIVRKKDGRFFIDYCKLIAVTCHDISTFAN